MKLERHIFFVILFISITCYSQEDDFFIYMPEKAEIIKKNEISKSFIISQDYENGKLSSVDTSMVEHYDSIGRLTFAIEFFDFERHLYFKYDSISRIIETEYFWVELKNWRKYNYYYDSKSRLIKYCELNKTTIEKEYKQSECFELHWTKNQIDYVTNAYSDTVFYYKGDKDKRFRYTNKDVIDAEYRNGLLVMRKYSNKTYLYERNNKGQETKIEILQGENNKIGEMVYEYDNGLPVKFTSYDKNQEVEYVEVFEYIQNNDNNR